MPLAIHDEHPLLCSQEFLSSLPACTACLAEVGSYVSFPSPSLTANIS